MKVSVCITTYNNEKYIAQAIESILTQKADFNYEIIIGEDDSADNTRNIVKQYYLKHPDRIRLLLNDRSNVIYIDGKPTGIWNLINVIGQAKGEYVALLDGDDYWLTNDKLQKQVDFLDNNKEFTICFHNAIEYREEENVSTNALPDNFPQITSLEKLLEYNYIPTCTVMYRRSAMPKLPPWFTQLRMSDWPLHILVAQHGSIGFISEVMGCYRMHKQGSWYSLDLIQKYLYILKAYHAFRQYFSDNKCYSKIIRQFCSRYYLLISSEHIKSKKYLLAIKYKVAAYANLHN